MKAHFWHRHIRSLIFLVLTILFFFLWFLIEQPEQITMVFKLTSKLKIMADGFFSSLIGATGCTAFIILVSKYLGNKKIWKTEKWEAIYMATTIFFISLLAFIGAGYVGQTRGWSIGYEAGVSSMLFTCFIMGPALAFLHGFLRRVPVLGLKYFLMFCFMGTMVSFIFLGPSSGIIYFLNYTSVAGWIYLASLLAKYLKTKSIQLLIGRSIRSYARSGQSLL